MVVLSAALPEAEAWSIVQGTATRLPLLLVVDDEVDDVAVELGVWAEELSCTTANSTRPDCGLMRTSFTVPMLVPEEPWIWAPWTCEARMDLWPEERPVALNVELEELEVALGSDMEVSVSAVLVCCELELPELGLALEELAACVCAPATMHAASMAIVLIS